MGGDNGYHLAQLNVARALYPLDAPGMAAFMDALEPINALADAAPGFVWRLQDDDGNATSIRPFEDETILVNLSLWESLDALRVYVYDGPHLDYLRRRKEWFEQFEGPYVALWWVPRGSIPTPHEGRERLEHLRANGPSPLAFTFKRVYPPPG